MEEGLTFADWDSPVIKFPQKSPQSVSQSVSQSKFIKYLTNCAREKAGLPHDSLIYHTRGLPVVIGDCEGQQWLEARLDLAVPI